MIPSARYRITKHRDRAWIQLHLEFSANLALETALGLTISGCQLSPAQDFVWRFPCSSVGTKFTALSLEATDLTQAIKMQRE